MTVICVVKSSRSIILKFPSVSHCIVSVSPVLKSFACKGQCTCPHSIKTCWMSISYMHIMFVRSIVSSLVCKGKSASDYLHRLSHPMSNSTEKLWLHGNWAHRSKPGHTLCCRRLFQNQLSSSWSCSSSPTLNRPVGCCPLSKFSNPAIAQNKSDQSSKDRSATAHQVWSFHGLRYQVEVTGPAPSLASKQQRRIVCIFPRSTAVRLICLMELPMLDCSDQ